jgi:hypothetical protein
MGCRTQNMRYDDPLRGIVCDGILYDVLPHSSLPGSSLDGSGSAGQPPGTLS